VVDNQFFDELELRLLTVCCPVVITDDLNLHRDIVGGAHARRFHEIIDTFGLHQSVSGPTHGQGRTLDVVVTQADLPLSAVTVRPCGEYFDHSLVPFQLPLHYHVLRCGTWT